jgi:hypothetical protein
MDACYMHVAGKRIRAEYMLTRIRQAFIAALILLYFHAPVSSIYELPAGLSGMAKGGLR